MKVERIDILDGIELVRCSLFEATHIMRGDAIVSLERDQELGWIAVGANGERLTHLNEQGFSINCPGDKGNEGSFYNSAKYISTQEEEEIVIKLTEKEAEILKVVLGGYNCLNIQEAKPILSTGGTSLFWYLDNLGIKTDHTIRTHSSERGMNSVLSLKRV